MDIRILSFLNYNIIFKEARCELTTLTWPLLAKVRLSNLTRAEQIAGGGGVWMHYSLLLLDGNGGILVVNWHCKMRVS